MALTSKDIAIGSGELYITEATRTDGVVTIPADATIETEENRLGHIKDGATITYTPTYYEAKDDMGLVAKTIVSEEELIFKSGVMTWNLETLTRLAATGTYAEDNSGKKILKLGGIKNANIKEYILRFVHADGVHRITLVGTNDSGFELGYQKDKETVIDAQFKAKPYDATGHLLQMEDTSEVTPAPDPEGE